MSVWKPGIAAVVVVVGLVNTSSAQTSTPTTLDRGQSVDNGAKNSGQFYTLTNCFDPLGLSGNYPGYLGFGLSGYGPGAILSNQSNPWPLAKTSAPSLMRSSNPTMPTKVNSSQNLNISKKTVSQKSSRK